MEEDKVDLQNIRKKGSCYKNVNATSFKKLMNKCRQRENKVRNYSDKVNGQNGSGQIRVLIPNHHCTEENNIYMFHSVHEKNRCSA